MKRIICGIVLMAVILTGKVYGYSDIDTSYWAYNDINELTNRNILTGYPDGSFKAEDKITRAEFITILMKIVEPNADVSSSTGYWADKSIELAKSKGILKTEDYSEFNPEIPITRKEICNMIYRSVPELENISLEKLSIKTEFIDIDKNNKDEYKISVLLNYFGVVSGYPDKTIRLENTSTRAEICAFINNYLKNKCKILAKINDNELVIYENDIAIVDKEELPAKLKRWNYSIDVPYATTTIKKVDLFPFNEVPKEYKELFDEINTSDHIYFQYRKKFGENMYVIAVSFDTANNTYNSEVYAGYSYLHLDFQGEEISIVDSFDTDEVRRQLEGNANVGELVYPGKTHSTSAFYVVDKLPSKSIRFDRNILDLFVLNTNELEKLSSYHSLIVNLEGR